MRSLGNFPDFHVALTFDAEHPDRPWCPPDNATRILDTLADRDVRGTFFVQGRWAQAYPDTARRIADEGHLVGHHSHFHARMPMLIGAGPNDAFVDDVTEGARAIETHAGSDPRPWFRCPFGAGHDDPRVLERLATLGYRNVHWHVELEDWEPWRTGPAIAADAIARSLEHGDGAVMLLHTWPGGTADAVGPLIDGLRDAGASFVTVGALERLP